MYAFLEEARTAAPYAWVITKDYLADETVEAPSYSNAPGITGPSDAPADLLAQLEAGKGYRFRIKDDDGETYYDGRIVFADELDPGEVTLKTSEYRQPVVSSAMPEEGFGPLWDFGTPNAGATEIFYFDKNGRMGGL